MEYFMNNLITKEKIDCSHFMCACEKQIKYKLMVFLNCCRFFPILFIYTCRYCHGRSNYHEGRLGGSLKTV